MWRTIPRPHGLRRGLFSIAAPRRSRPDVPHGRGLRKSLSKVNRTYGEDLKRLAE